MPAPSKQRDQWNASSIWSSAFNLRQGSSREDSIQIRRALKPPYQMKCAWLYLSKARQSNHNIHQAPRHHNDFSRRLPLVKAGKQFMLTRGLFDCAARRILSDSQHAARFTVDLQHQIDFSGGERG